MEQIPVLVTGGCGFLGTAIVSALLEAKNYAVIAVDLNPPSPGSKAFASDVKYVRCNILDVQQLQQTFQDVRPSIVIHAAGVVPLGAKRYSMEDRDIVFTVNIEGTRNVLQVSKECGAKGLVYTSSVTVVLDEVDKDFRNVDETWSTGRATTSYGISKTKAEELVLSANTPGFATCALRPAPIFGPNDLNCIPAIYSCIAAGQTPFTLGTGTNLQDFVYVDNVADAHVLVTSNLLNSQSAAGEAIFITNNEPITLRDFCIAIWKEFGHVPKSRYIIPERVAWWMGLAAEWVNWLAGTDGVFSRGVVSDGCRHRYVSMRKARQILSFSPKVGLEEGLKISCQHYQKQIDARTRVQ